MAIATDIQNLVSVAEIEARFLMRGDLIDRKSHLFQVLDTPRVDRVNGRVSFWAVDLDGDIRNAIPQSLPVRLLLTHYGREV